VAVVHNTSSLAEDIIVRHHATESHLSSFISLSLPLSLSHNSMLAYQVCDDTIDTLCTSKRQRAAIKDLVHITLGDMLHCNDDARS
jgi:hypothetical protein